MSTRSASLLSRLPRLSTHHRQLFSDSIAGIALPTRAERRGLTTLHPSSKDYSYIRDAARTPQERRWLVYEGRTPQVDEALQDAEARWARNLYLNILAAPLRRCAITQTVMPHSLMLKLKVISSSSCSSSEKDNGRNDSAEEGQAGISVLTLRPIPSNLGSSPRHSMPQSKGVWITLHHDLVQLAAEMKLQKRVTIAGKGLRLEADLVAATTRALKLETMLCIDPHFKAMDHLLRTHSCDSKLDEQFYHSLCPAADPSSGSVQAQQDSLSNLVAAHRSADQDFFLKVAQRAVEQASAARQQEKGQAGPGRFSEDSGRATETTSAPANQRRAKGHEIKRSVRAAVTLWRFASWIRSLPSPAS